MGYGSLCRRTFGVALALVLMGEIGHAAGEAVSTIAPTSADWTISPPLPDAKEAVNISGAACYQVGGERKSCLLAGDEAKSGRYARFFSIEGRTIVPGPTITLLSDPDKDVLREWGAFGEKKLYGRIVEGVIRSTFVIDENGVLTHAWYNVRATGHVAKIMRDLGLAAA